MTQPAPPKLGSFSCSLGCCYSRARGGNIPKCRLKDRFSTCATWGGSFYQSRECSVQFRLGDDAEGLVALTFRRAGRAKVLVQFGEMSPGSLGCSSAPSPKLSTLLVPQERVQQRSFDQTVNVLMPPVVEEIVDRVAVPQILNDNGRRLSLERSHQRIVDQITFIQEQRVEVVKVTPRRCARTARHEEDG